MESMRSPTALTNSVRRPKSPRRPDYRDHRGNVRSHNSNNNNTSNAERSNSTGRRRAHAEMGHFGTDASLTPDRSSSGGLLDALACAPQKAPSDFTEEYAPARTRFGACFDTTAIAAGVAGTGLTNFAMTAAEVDRQECKSDNRGDDADFFVDPKRRRGTSDYGTLSSRGEDSHSLVDSLESYLSEGDRRDSNSDELKRDSSRPNHRRQKSAPGGTIRSNDTSGAYYPDSIHVMNETISTISPPRLAKSSKTAKGLDISPPKVGRTSNSKEFQPQAAKTNMREARMGLFRNDNETGPQHQVRLARALQDLKRQDNTLDGWKRQLEVTQQHLDETLEELEQTKKVAQERQFKATEARARSLHERKKLEDMYAEELAENQTLRDSVTKLELEVSTLKESLRNVKLTSSASAAMSPERKGLELPSNQVIALKAEIIDLRSQLAEAHAAHIDDSSTLHSNSGEEEDKLRKKLRALQKELNELRDKSMDIKKLKRQHRESEESLRQKLEQLESQSMETQSKLERNLRESVREENELRAELSKVKANMQRLERERSRKRLHSAADVDRLNKELTKGRAETKEILEKMLTERKETEKVANKLRSELVRVSTELRQTKQKNTSQNSKHAAERSKLEKDLGRVRGELKELSDQLKNKITVITSQAKRIANLEAEIKKVRSDKASGHDISKLSDEVKFRKANEYSLRKDLNLQKSLLERVKSRATHSPSRGAQSPSRRSLQPTDEATALEELEREIEFKANEEKKSDEDNESYLREQIRALELKVANLQQQQQSVTQEDPSLQLRNMEQNLRREINGLKTKVQKAESRLESEKTRADEERRTSKEKAAKHLEELEQVREEVERTRDEKLQLREELETLRKQLLGSLAGDASIGDDSTTDMDAPQKVRRLRNELALARARLESVRVRTRPAIISPPASIVTKQSPARSEHDTVSEEMPYSPSRNSQGSYESSWNPPVQKQGDEEQADNEDKVVETGEDPILETRSPPAVSPNHSIEPDVKAPLDMATHYKNKNVEDLHRQLQESSKRLDKANSRLAGLVQQSGLPATHEPSPVPYKGINRQMIMTLKSSKEEDTGVMDEVVESDSGNIEVSQLRYVDL